MSPETIDAMLSAGVTAEVLAAAWKAELAKQEGADQERRARDADRQRRHRESRDVTVTGCDSTDPFPLEVSPQTPLPKTPNQVTSPLSPPGVLAEKKQAIASCLRIAFPCPDGISAEQWTAFRDQRKKKLNDRSYLLLCNKLTTLAEAGWPPGDMIDLAIERGWETVFEPRTPPNGNVTSLQRNRPNLTALLRASSGDPESGFGTRPSLPASGNG